MNGMRMKALYRKTIEEALAHAPGVELASPPRVSGLEGKRVGRRAGNALEFSEYREYQAGDDLRRLDWNVYARSEQFMVKQFCEEVDPRCDIILDESASMSVDETKSRAALGLAAILSQAAVNAGFSIAVWHAGRLIEKEPQGSNPLLWSIRGFDADTSPGETFANFGGVFHQRGIRILISDLLWPEEPSGVLARLSDGAKRAAILRILADDELEPPGEGNVELVDAETGEEREVLLEEGMIRRFRDRAGRHFAMWEECAGRFGIPVTALRADDILPDWRLGELFKAGLLK